MSDIYNPPSVPEPIQLPPQSNQPPNGGDFDLYIHPHLVQASHPDKGRQLLVSMPVPAGTILLADPPYAIVPMVEPSSNSTLICSNLSCRQLVFQHTKSVCCPNHCAKDVVWCNNSCRATDQARHDYECAWLQHHSTVIRCEEGEYYFHLLWLTVRIMAARYLERNGLSVSTQPQQQRWPQRQNEFPRGWESIRSLRSNYSTWPLESIQHWKTLILKFLVDPTSLQEIWDPDDMLDLICQQETNFFGLYPRVNGVYPIPKPPVGKGVRYGLALYPRAAMMNHSCCPNVTDQPDGRGRMVMTAQRDIDAGEECMISYFDLTQHIGLDARKQLLRKDFHFDCHCIRCVEEARG